MDQTMRKTAIPIAPLDINTLIATVRGQKVILDADLAKIYHVPTKALNQAVKRNREKFREDFLFQLTPEEAEEVRNFVQQSAGCLRSQIVTSKLGRGGRRYAPYAFTEHGALMAANLLNSPRAVAMSLYVIRAFIKMREDLAANAAILKRLAEIDKTLLLPTALSATSTRNFVRCWSSLRNLRNPKSGSTSKKIRFRTESKESLSDHDPERERPSRLINTSLQRGDCGAPSEARTASAVSQVTFLK